MGPERRMAAASVLIVTTGHHAEDGRLVRHRDGLRCAGFDVTVLSLRYSSRVRRFVLGPWRVCMEVARRAPACVILPDPELHILVAPLLRGRTGVIADVHEDYEAVASDRAWLPRVFRPTVRWMTRLIPAVRDRFSDAVLVADARLGGTESVLVSNRPASSGWQPSTDVCPQRRLIYVGDIRASRGQREMLELLSSFPDLHLDLVGPCADHVDLFNQIHDYGLDDRVSWHGRLPYSDSWELAAGALAGLSLLHPTPAFREAIPTKIWEYWAAGIAVLASDLPAQRRLVLEAEGGAVGPVPDLVEELRRWLADPASARRVGTKGQQFYRHNDDGSAERLCEVVTTVTSDF